MGSRILTVADIFTALTEDRPYRRSLNQKEIKEILKSKVKINNIDQNIVDILLKNYEDIYLKVRRKQQESISIFEKKISKTRIDK